ncbi:hypothetical protein ASZ78_011197 [Callipepla squamata]|uniref:Deoxyuridine 5'-triphosphate nucleotidohydrolase n=1 Tax=Callipepla squamata TaxID=9009 RepID=A0A226N6X0_CALSU|nr:hypothetical protein ASZ78_011197 [Callipepla squamata]
MPCSEAVLQPSPSKKQKGSAAEEPSVRLRFTKLSDNARAPSKGSARAAGYDLYSAYDCVIPPMEKAVVKTDIQVALPSGCYGRVGKRAGHYKGSEGRAERSEMIFSLRFRLRVFYTHKSSPPRSGLAAKHFIDVGVVTSPNLECLKYWQHLLIGYPFYSFHVSAGVIDEDYRGNVGVVLFNFGKETFEVKKGDRIAQLICERIFYPELEEVQVSCQREMFPFFSGISSVT